MDSHPDPAGGRRTRASQCRASRVRRVADPRAQAAFISSSIRNLVDDMVSKMQSQRTTEDAASTPAGSAAGTRSSTGSLPGASPTQKVVDVIERSDGTRVLATTAVDVDSAGSPAEPSEPAQKPKIAPKRVFSRSTSDAAASTHYENASPSVIGQVASVRDRRAPCLFRARRRH